MRGFKHELIGKKFDYLTVVAEHEIRKEGKHVQWLCTCICGNTKIVPGYILIKQPNLHCGCKPSPAIVHGLSDTKFYKVWATMHSRCYNRKVQAYVDYGGRGISICDRWHTFINFYGDMFSSYSEGLSLDRIDFNGNYEPDNCKWSTAYEQSNNRRNNVKLETPFGVLQLKEIAKRLDMNYGTLKSRYRAGWSIARIIFPL